MTKSIHSLIKNAIKTDHNWKLQLLQNWPDIMGSLHNKVSIEKINDDTITLAVIDSTWMQELYLLSPVLLKTINQTLDQPYIKQIRFKTAGIKKTEPLKKESPIAYKKMPERALTPREQHALDKINDPVLKQSLKAFLMRCSREK